MAIVDFLERNARLYPGETSLVEINPANQPDHAMTWREFNLIESSSTKKYRAKSPGASFDVKANRLPISATSRRPQGRQGRML